MEGIRNLDLLAVGIATAAIVILGFVVFFSKWRSLTNRTFLVFTSLTAVWGIANYAAYNVVSPELSLWLFRIVIFLAVWHDFFIFQLFYVFPNDKVTFSKNYKFFLIPLVAFVSVLNLTPLVFSGIGKVSTEGQLVKIINGPAIPLFGIMVLGLVVSGLFLVIRKTIHSQGIEKTQLKYVLTGTVITFLLLIAFNFILPAFFDNPSFIPLGPVFLFPFVVATFYAIFRHHLLNIKVVATEILAFILAVVSLFEVIISRDIETVIFRSGIFMLVLGFGILLIKSVLKEVEQREELQRLNIELEDKKLKLEELSHFKTQLLSLASHQVKAPLAVIKQFASILIDGLYGPVSPKVKETLGKMKASADDLINLINNLLDLRKVEEGKMEYQFTRVDFLKLVKDLVEELRPLAANKKLELSFETDLKEAFVSADATKLAQVVQNIIDNAIKYTPEGFVKVKLEESGGMLTVSVVDSGLGLSAELVPHLFEEFQRDERVKKEIRGTGLGLFIAKKILEAHGGTLSAESEGVGKGSVFYVRLKKI